MAASLSDLPNELLLSIASSLESESSLNALARTNRCLYLSLNDYLYKHNAVYGRSSALTWAARHGQQRSTALSIAQGGEVDVRGSEDYTKARFMSGYLRKQTKLFSREDLFDENLTAGYTPLYISSMLGHANVANLLIINGANTKLSLGRFATPLQAAVENGHVRTFELLLENGVSIDKPAPFTSLTALHMACHRGHFAIVQILTNAGADVMARDTKGNTPLHFALKYLSQNVSSADDHLRDVQRLLLRDADPQARNRQGETCARLARQVKNSNIPLLFRKGSRVALHEVAGPQHQAEELEEAKSMAQLWASYLDRQAEAAARKVAEEKQRLAVEDAAAARNVVKRQNMQARHTRAERQQPGEEEKIYNASQEHYRKTETFATTPQQDAARLAWSNMRAQADSKTRELNSSVTEPSSPSLTTTCSHESLSWNRKKGKADCAFCRRGISKSVFFQCVDCGSVACRSCTVRELRRV